MYKSYVSASDYYGLGCDAVDADQINKYLLKASRHIDSLTFNRIQRFGWDNLTEFQQDTIREVICDQAGFLYENRDSIDSMLNSYSINGVSMSFGSGFNIYVEGGLPIKTATYKLLEQTGLCSRLAR